MKNTTKIVKRFDFTLSNAVVKKDAGGDCVIEGYANTSTKDRVGDIVQPEAFTKSLPTYLKNPVLLANHDWNDPCGVVQSAEITDKGLFVKARISDTREDIKTLVREGCLRTFSIGYNELDADYNEDTKTKVVKELELLEISIVTVPANAEAVFQLAAKPAEAEKADEGKKSMTPRTAKDLKDFISTVKAAVGRDLSGNEVVAICDYFNETKEEIMTKKELIALLKGIKSDVAAAGTPEAAKADPAAKPEADKPADGGDALAQVMAKLDAIAQGVAQCLEAMKQDAAEDAAEDKDDAEKADKPADDKDKPKAEDDKDKPKAEDDCKGEKPADDKEDDKDEDDKDKDEKSLTVAEVDAELAAIDAALADLDDNENL